MTEGRLGNYVIVRREFHRDGFAFWFCNRDTNGKIGVAKPTELEYVEHSEGFALPDPTMYLPSHVAKDFYEGLTQQLKYQGEQFMEAHTAIKTKDENLADLRKILDRTLGLLERK